MKGKPTTPRKRFFVSNSDILDFLLAPFLCEKDLPRKPPYFFPDEQILYVPFPRCALQNSPVKSPKIQQNQGHQ